MIIKNPLNYTGSKDRIMEQLLENFDYSKGTFIDFFAGSGVVGVNVADKFRRVILNDGCWQIIELLKAIYEDKDFISKVDEVIATYNLSKENKDEFLELRELYNENFKDEDKFRADILYALITHAFNYFAVFTKDDRFSVPSGKGRSSFNSNIRKKLENYIKAMEDKDLEFYSFKQEDFINVIKDTYNEDEINSVMFYFDPPYSCSDAVNRSYGLKWNEGDDLRLMDFCDWLNSVGASFALSNVLENNGKENKRMKEWAKKYNVVHISLDYNNCHYQRKNAGETKEVIIKNF